jgi:hypothetical protein
MLNFCILYPYSEGLSLETSTVYAGSMYEIDEIH